MSRNLLSPPHSASIPALTLRAVISGMLVGGALSWCNIYSGLKVGFTANMSITSALLAYGSFRLAHRAQLSKPLSLQENVIHQTAASAAGSIAGAGLVAPLPALTLISGRQLGLELLIPWTLVISLLGVLVGVSLRQKMIVEDQLPFPHGLATATMLQQMYQRGRDASGRVRALLMSLLSAGAWTLWVKLKSVPVMWFPGGLSSAPLKNLGFGLDPSVLMVGIGALIGPRSSISMALGALLSWGVLAPWVIEQGYVRVELGQNEVWFSPLVNWLLWPGVALMVASALASFLASLPHFARSLTGGHKTSGGKEPHLVPRSWFRIGLSVVALLCVIAQMTIFSIGLLEASLAVALSFGLAVVAGRVSGETGIPPIGAMGKITQLTFALVSPGNATANLMSANVTGGAASQCSDMLHDLKAGHLLGAWPRHQAIAQAFGVSAGCLAGCTGYLLLVPMPERQLMTSQWPAPAVAQWKAVAELFTEGASHLPPGALIASLVAATLGVALVVLERVLPKNWQSLVPSAPSIGLAMVIPAYYSLGALAGSMLAVVSSRVFPRQSARYTIVVGAGLVAGEGLTGVLLALLQMAGAP